MEDYYSLDLLLAESQKIPCLFNILVPGMGHLEGTNERDIQSHSPIEVPCWLASVLSQEQEDQEAYLTIQIPKAFNTRIRNALSASAKNVNLKTLAANSGGAWYASGKVLLETIDDNNLRQVLHHTLQSRLGEIMDLGSRPPLTDGDRVMSNDGDEFVLGLDAWEKEILAAGQQMAKRMRAWEKSRMG